MNLPRRSGALVCAVGVLVAEMVVLAVVPPPVRQVVSTIMLTTAWSTLITVAVVVRFLPAIRKRRLPPSRVTREETAPAPPTRPAPSLGDNTPDRTVQAAWILARHGYDPAWLAEVFHLPPAFVELLAADASRDDEPPS